MTLYRFELAFDGETQDVGLFHGIYDAVPDKTETDTFEQAFHMLAAPELNKKAEFWFKPAGLIRFANALLKTQELLGQYNWQLVLMTRQPGQEPVIYQDRDQIALQASSNMTETILDGEQQLQDVINKAVRETELQEDIS